MKAIERPAVVGAAMLMLLAGSASFRLSPRAFASQAQGRALTPAVTASTSGLSPLPIGLYGVAQSELKHAAAAGFNLVHSYAFEGEATSPVSIGPKQALQYLDAAHELGLRVLMGIPRNYLRTEDLASVAAWITALEDHPALAAWYEDEQLEQAGRAMLEKTKALICELDPAHPVIAAENEGRGPLEGIADIRISMVYPFVSRAASALPGSLSDAFSPGMAMNEGLWLALQAFGHESIEGLPAPFYRWPTPVQLRALTYLSFIEGAAGVVFFSYESPTLYDPGAAKQGKWPYRRYRSMPEVNPALWEGLTKLVGELNRAGAMLAGRRTDVPVSSNRRGAVRAALFSSRRNSILVAVNGSAGSLRASMGPVEASRTGRVEVLFEQRAVSLRGPDAVLTDTFEPYGVHVYVLSGDLQRREDP